MVADKSTKTIEGKPFARKVTLTWAVVVAVLLVAGAPFLFDRLVNGLGVIDTTNRVPWGLWVVSYTWFSGLAGGLFVISSFAYLFRVRRFMPIARLALLGSVVALVVSMLLIGLDLGALRNVGGALLFFHWSSALSWEIKMYAVFAVIVIIQFALVLRNESSSIDDRGNKNLAIRVLSGLGLALSFVGPPGGTGMFFATVRARGLWGDGVTAVLFYVLAVATAAAFLLIVHQVLARLRESESDGDAMRGLAATLGLSLLAAAFVLYFQLMVVGAGSSQGALAVDALVAGSFAPGFWVGGVVVGLLIAGALALVAFRSGRVSASMGAGAAAMAGVFCLRYVFVIAGLAVPLYEGMPIPVYVPNIAEIMVVVFSVGVAIGLFGLVVRWLPLEVVGASEGMPKKTVVYAVPSNQEGVQHGAA